MCLSDVVQRVKLMLVLRLGDPTRYAGAAVSGMDVAPWHSGDPERSQLATAQLRRTLADLVDLVASNDPGSLESRYASSVSGARDLVDNLRLPVPQPNEYEGKMAEYQAALERRGVVAADLGGYLAAFSDVPLMLYESQSLHDGTVLLATLFTGRNPLRGRLDLDDIAVIMSHQGHHYAVVPMGDVAILMPDLTPTGFLGSGNRAAQMSLGIVFRMSLLPADMRALLQEVDVDALVERGEVLTGLRVGEQCWKWLKGDGGSQVAAQQLAGR